MTHRGKSVGARNALRDVIWGLDFANLGADRKEIPQEYDALVDIALAKLKETDDAFAAVQSMASVLDRDWDIQLTDIEMRRAADDIAFIWPALGQSTMKD